MTFAIFADFLFTAARVTAELVGMAIGHDTSAVDAGLSGKAIGIATFFAIGFALAIEGDKFRGAVEIAITDGTARLVDALLVNPAVAVGRARRAIGWCIGIEGTIYDLFASASHGCA